MMYLASFLVFELTVIARWGSERLRAEYHQGLHISTVEERDNECIDYIDEVMRMLAGLGHLVLLIYAVLDLRNSHATNFRTSTRCRMDSSTLGTRRDYYRPEFLVLHHHHRLCSV